MRDWVLRDEILIASHRWPLIVAFFLAGSLLGWLAASVWPAPYRAAAEVSVSIDTYRSADDRYVAAFSNTEFRNPDDYKHWQMSQLSVLATSDEYLTETLGRLRQQDASWQGVDIPTLRDMLRVYWRNAGRWRLVAEAGDARQAQQAVIAWRDVILEKTRQKVSHSKSIFLLDLELQALAAQQLHNQLEAEALPGIKMALLDWQEDRSSTSGGASLATLERWRLYALAAQAASLDPAWQSLLSDLPVSGKDPEAYGGWIDRAIASIDQKIEASRVNGEALAREQERLEGEWESAVGLASGLSATLSVEPLVDDSLDVEQERAASLSALVGGMLGIVAWSIFLLARLASRRSL